MSTEHRAPAVPTPATAHEPERPGPFHRWLRSALLVSALALSCTVPPDGTPVGRAGKPPPLPPPSAPAMDAEQSAETTAIGNDAGEANALAAGGGDRHARVSGSIPGVSVEVTSTYAYRDWMPRMGGPRGEDGGSPLHIAIGLVIENGSEQPVTLDRSARLGATGTPLEPVRLEDLASETVWPLELQPGAQRRLQIGTRDGPYFPLGEALDLEIDLSDAAGASVRISIDDLPIGRTD